MITPQQFRNPQVKPKWNVPVGVMESIVAFNCRKYGFPRPVVAMPMWEGAGNRAFDYSGNRNHGIVTSPATPDMNWDRNALRFDGSNIIQGMKFPTALNFGNDDKWTVVVRMNQEVSYNDMFIGEYLTSNNYIFNDPSVKLNFDSNGESNDMDPMSSVGTTYDLTYVADGVANTLTAYHNGNFHQQLTSRAYTGFIINTIGAPYYSGTNCFQGWIYYAYVFDVALTARQAKFLHDNPYFMFQIPENLYGTIITSTGLVDCKLRIKDSFTNLVDGKAQIQDTAADLVDGKVVIIETATNLADGKVRVKDIITGVVDGKANIKDDISGIVDGKVQLQDTTTGTADGKVNIKDDISGLVDGKVQLKDEATGLLDGKVQTKDSTAGLVDGKIQIKDLITGFVDGRVQIKDLMTGLVDGKVQLKDSITDLLDCKVQIKDKVTGLVDGLVRVLDIQTSLIDGKLRISDVVTGLVDGSVKIKDKIVSQLDGKVTIAWQSKNLFNGLLQIPARYRMIASSEQQHDITVITGEVQYSIELSSEPQHNIIIIRDEE